MPPSFRLRPGKASDLTHAVRLYDACLGSDKLVSLLFPRKEEDPESYKRYLYRLYAKRYWSVDWIFTFVVKEGGEIESDNPDDTIVGFACWKRPSADVSFGERWFTLFSWIAPLVRTFISLQDTLLAPLPIDPHAAHAFDRVFPPIEKTLFAGKHRAEWWYLSTLAVHPSAQGIGLGALLMAEGLTRADRWQQRRALLQEEGGQQQRGTGGGEAKVRGKVWLIGLRGTDAFYSRFGFVEVGRANVGDLSEWDGGIVMFRE